MSVELATAYVSLVVSGDKVAPGVKRALGQTEADADRAGKSAGARYGKSFGRTLAAGAALGGLFAITKGVQFLGDSLDEAREAQVVGARTVNVIKKMGGASNVTAKQVGDLSSAISKKVGIDDEAIQSGANLLLTFGNVRNEAGKGNDIFNQTTRLMVDMSAAMGQDAKSSAIQLGKALNDPIKGVSALSRVGVSFTQQQRDQIKALTESGKALDAQKIILGEVKKQFGGAAKAMSTPADRAKVAWGNLKEQIGTELLPVVDKVSTYMADKAIPAISDFFDEMRTGKGVGGDVADVLGNVRDVLKDATPLAKGLVGALSNMPDWAVKGGLVAGAGLLVAKKIGGGKGGALGGGAKGGVVPVYVTNMGGGVGGGKGKGAGPISTGRLALGAGLAAAGGVRTYDLTKPNKLGLQALPKDFPTQLASLARYRTGVMDITKSIGALDSQVAGMIQRNPAAGFDVFSRYADKADLSIGALRKAMPAAAAAIDKTGAQAKSAAVHADDWRNSILGANTAVSKVDGRKPTITWRQPGLLEGINRARDMKSGIDKVDGTRPTSHFALPNIGARIAEAASLNRTLDQAARDRVSTITIRRVVNSIQKGADDLAGVLPGFGSNSVPSPRSLERAVERGARAGVGDRNRSSYADRRG